MGLDSVLVDRARSNIGHLNCLASLRPGQRPQIKVTDSPDASRKIFKISIYGNPAGGYFSIAWKYMQAAERKYWYLDSTRKDLEHLAVLLKDVHDVVQEAVNQRNLQILKVFQNALQSFQEQGLQHYLTSCCEGLPNAKPISTEERQFREQKTRELRAQLDAAAAKVKEALEAAGPKLVMTQSLPALGVPGDQEIRQGYLYLNGLESIQLTEDMVEVSITHFTADRFLQAIHGWGGKYVSLVSALHTFPAIEIEQVKKNFSKQLRHAGLLNSDVWESFESGGKIYLVNRQDYRQIRAYLTHHGMNEHLKVHLREKPALNTQPRTVVLKGGIHSSIYSPSTAQEAAAFLTQGYNVVLFEDKYPKTFKLPSREQVQQTVKCVYTYMADRGITPQNILWKGTSLGIISALVGAAAYPGTLGFADQGFATLTEAATDYVRVMTSTKIPQWAVRPLVHQYLTYYDKDFDVAALIPKVQGPFCILNNKNDGFIPREESEKLADIAASSKGKVLAMDNPEIHHAEGWFKDPEAKVQVLRFLSEAGFVPAPIL